MGKLTTEDRKELPKKDFALPAKKKFPVNDRSHAANAKARATQMVKKGLISDAEHKKIMAKADKVLGKSEPDGDEPVVKTKKLVIAEE